MSTERPLPIFKPADPIGPTYAGEVSVECSICPDGWTEAQPNVPKAYEAFDLHACQEHPGWTITEPWQAAEVLSDRVDGFSDAEGQHVWQWVCEHVGQRGDISPQLYLLLVSDACEDIAAYASAFAEQARALHAEMPLDAATAGV